MDLRGAAIAVTGATGFLGRYIVDALLARGAHVIGVVRNPARVPELAARVELRRADLGDRAALARGFAGTAAVVANAALFSLGNLRWADHERANIEGTRNVLAAMADAGVRRLVHVSSVAVYRGRGRAIAEDHPQLGPDSRRTFTNAYAISKALSEQLAWEQARALGIAMTAVRPCAIYGAFDPNFMRVIRRLMRLPVSVVPVRLRLPLVYAGDVAEAIARALERPVAVGRAYNVTGAERPFAEFLAAWREAGGPAPWVAIPIPVPFAIGYDTSRAEADLGWRARSYVDGLRESFAREAASS
jgi:nucleoside-diphosphate-sugar epimerase